MRGLRRRLLDTSDAASLVAHFRRRRMRLFRQLLARVPRPARILDVGGRQAFWEVVGLADEPGLRIELLNTGEEPPQCTRSGFRAHRGDGRDMRAFGDGEFDVVFSNSVIEHLGTLADQQRFAAEVQRVGQRYFVQTPNRYFPIEPHFAFPAFQFLPMPARVALVRRFQLAFEPRIPEARAAEAYLRSFRLLARSELRALFPGATLHAERILGWPKSFVAYGGWS